MLKDLWRKAPNPGGPGKPRRESGGRREDSQETRLFRSLWAKCGHCGSAVYREEVRANFYICPKCHGYFRLKAYQRLRMVADPGSFQSWDGPAEEKNPLGFPGYEQKLAENREKTGLTEAVLTGKIRILGQETAVGVCDARFLM